MPSQGTELSSLETDCEADGAPSLLKNLGVVRLLNVDDTLPCTTENQSRSSSKRKEISSSSSSSSSETDSDKDVETPEYSDDEDTDKDDVEGISITTTANTCFDSSSDENIVHSLERLFLSDSEPEHENVHESNYVDPGVQKDKDGDTKLHLAIIFPVFPYVRRMLKSKTIEKYLNAQNDLFQTPLHLAVEKNIRAPLDIIVGILRAGADPMLQDKEGRTFLHVLCENGDYETLCGCINACGVARYLINQCIDIVNYEGLTALQIAVVLCREIGAYSADIVRKVLSLGANVNIPDRKSGRTVLHFASELGNVDIVNILVNHPGIELGKETYKGETAVALAYHRQHNSVVQLLMDNGVVCNLHELKQFGPVRHKVRKTKM